MPTSIPVSWFIFAVAILLAEWLVYAGLKRVEKEGGLFHRSDRQAPVVRGLSEVAVMLAQIRDLIEGQGNVVATRIAEIPQENHRETDTIVELLKGLEEAPVNYLRDIEKQANAIYHAIEALNATLMATTQPTPDATQGEILIELRGINSAISGFLGSFNGDPEVRECAREIQKVVDGIPLSIEKQASRTLGGMVAIQETCAKLLKVNQEFLRFVYGGGGGYTDMTDEAAAVREKAKEIQKRYQLDWDEAMAQAKNLMSLQSGDGMRG